jgi:hypothetical protein
MQAGGPESADEAGKKSAEAADIRQQRIEVSQLVKEVGCHCLTSA